MNLLFELEKLCKECANFPEIVFLLEIENTDAEAALICWMADE